MTRRFIVLSSLVVFAVGCALATEVDRNKIPSGVASPGGGASGAPAAAAGSPSAGGEAGAGGGGAGAATAGGEAGAGAGGEAGIAGTSGAGG
jgi:hypothetical protein